MSIDTALESASEITDKEDSGPAQPTILKSEVEETNAVTPSLSPFPTAPDGGLHAWLKVLGGFLIYSNIWLVLRPTSYSDSTWSRLIVILKLCTDTFNNKGDLRSASAHFKPTTNMIFSKAPLLQPLAGLAQCRLGYSSLLVF